jgi:hypothetical protein
LLDLFAAYHTNFMPCYLVWNCPGDTIYLKCTILLGASRWQDMCSPLVSVGYCCTVYQLRAYSISDMLDCRLCPLTRNPQYGYVLCISSVLKGFCYARAKCLQWLHLSASALCGVDGSARHDTPYALYVVLVFESDKNVGVGIRV